MFNALSVSIEGDTEGLRRAAASLRNQGLVEALRFDWNGVSLRGWRAGDGKGVEGHAVCSVRTPDGFACCVGPLWYRGAFGGDALKRLIDDAGVNARPRRRPDGVELPGRIDATGLRGSHAIFLQRGDSAWLWNDAPGFVHVFGTEDGRFHSTSWLAARAYTGNAAIDEDAAIEYVLLGASHSDQTVAVGVQQLPLGHAVDLRSRRLRRWLSPEAWTCVPPRSDDEAQEAIAAHLRTVFEEIASAFRGRTRAALSGGFDSRLIVAGLLDQGERPKLFVYGDASSSDVAIAREVARAEGLSLSAIDKDALNSRFQEPDLDALVASARFFDGLPNDGVIDPGADRQTRIAQSADGHIALNGGGGEIFRNFFHLPDRPFEPRNVVRAFYRGFDARCLRRPRALERYQRRLADSIARSVGGTGADGRLQRQQIERVYPLFRCHYWMGVNNGIAARSGWFATPLVDLELVRLASTLPLSWKNAGALQSRLIEALHPGIARHRSSYGFRFSEGPDARARRSEWATRIRPVLARPLINATRRRLQGVGVPANLLSRYRALLPGEWRLDPALDLQRLPDEAAFSRALSVELLARGLVE